MEKQLQNNTTVATPEESNQELDKCERSSNSACYIGVSEVWEMEILDDLTRGDTSTV
ncbi:8277_t:CDS:2 [Funneliformis geosporum]|uniref:8277_t:CDS:1 n=1 Tax=Funneliformis geosporum TaxID=1117311 RepID=A0A9W4SCZ5_9GLOM|nr:8277_t:CDS:2 [Funneliformis geosporum]